jgi:hypothetical protein
MKKSILILAAGFIILLSANTSQAQAGDVAVGAMINSPTGLSIEGWVTDDISIDGALSFNVQDEFSNLYLHSDVLFHSNSVNEKFGVDGSNIDMYYGAGLRFISSDLNDIFGLRFPGGFSYRFEDTPLVAFFEIAPVLNLAPDAGLQFDGAAGARFYLN